MKHRSLSKRSLRVLVAVFLLGIPFLQSLASESSLADTNASAFAAQEPSTTNSLQVASGADTEAPATLVSNEKPLPPNIRPSGPVAEVIKLANSGLSEAVMLAYVTNSPHTFNLSAEQIVYLNDIGVPGSVITAMIQHDDALKTLLAAGAAAAQPAPPGAEPPPPQTEPPTPEPFAAQDEAGAAYPVEAPLTPPEQESVPMFYDALAPYGNWVDVAGYGRCWQPSVVVLNAGWQPYFDCGHWIYSDCGWYWLSDYSWGWAPFHYGCWFRHARLGWCWQPGHVWGPSWVSWRYNNNYCGWAPLPPGAGFTAGIGLTFHGHGAWDRDDFGLRPGHYHFVAWNHFQDRELRPHRLPPHEVARAYNTSTVVTRIIGDGHTVINNGLPPSRVVAATHRPVHRVALREMSSPTSRTGRAEHFEAGGQSLAVYRPTPRPASRGVPRTAGTGPGMSNRSSPSSSSNPTPWMPRQSVTELRQDNPPAGSAAPLILRGQQPSGLRESAPASSLILIGKGNSARPGSPYQIWSSAPSAASVPSAQPWPSAPSAASAASAQPWPSAPSAVSAPSAPPALGARPANLGRNEAPRTQGDRPANTQLPQRNWMGTASSSPQPFWPGGRDPVSSPRQPSSSSALSRPGPGAYQSVPRAPAAEVPRYAPAPSSVPQRSYSVPQRSYSAPAAAVAPARAPSFQARPAPSAPSAPSAPAAVPRSSAPQQSSGRGGR